MIDRFIFYPLAWLLCHARRNRIFHQLLFWVFSQKQMQGFAKTLSQRQAYFAYLKARAHCPAYADFLSKTQTSNQIFCDNFSNIPVTEKENYVKKYTAEQRCYNGKLLCRGVVIDESSGSSGEPTNWVRGPYDRNLIKHLLQMSLSRTYPHQKLFIINCFVMGPWATGMNVSMSFSDIAILKSLGSDLKKLENTLKTFGPNYNYLILGYPPFIKLFVNTTKLNLKDYNLQLITGGESISRGLQDYLSSYFKTIISSYGASDLDINMAVETPFSSKLRQLCFDHPDLCISLFGQAKVPMIFQCNPIDYYIETLHNGELIFTITRLNALAPKIRYNLHDVGGKVDTEAALKKLEKFGLSDQIQKPQSYFPLLYIYGRGDQTVLFLGVNITINDVDTILHKHAELYNTFHSFHMRVHENQNADSFLHLDFEFKTGLSEKDINPNLNLRDFIFAALKDVNQEFRELSKSYPSDRLIIDLHPSETGPFADRNQRIKQKYIS